MQVNFNFLQTGNNFANVGSINRGLSRGEGSVSKAVKSKNRDRLSISPQGKLMNAIDNLMKQKENIVEQKKQLVGKTIKSGGDMKSIKIQLENYAEQLENIDKQIAQIIAEQAKKAVEDSEKKVGKKSNENKTEEQLETEKLTKIAAVSDDIKQSKVVSSVKDKVDGKIRVEKSENELDKSRIDNLKVREKFGDKVTDMIKHAESLIEKKQANISSLQERLSELSESQGSTLEEISDKLNTDEKSDVVDAQPDTLREES
ncbi:MAG: hypothetical protein RRY54_01550 [Angelakisella sp.]